MLVHLIASIIRVSYSSSYHLQWTGGTLIIGYHAEIFPFIFFYSVDQESGINTIVEHHARLFLTIILMNQPDNPIAPSPTPPFQPPTPVTLMNYPSPA